MRHQPVEFLGGITECCRHRLELRGLLGASHHYLEAQHCGSQRLQWPSVELGRAGFDVILCRNVLLYLDPGVRVSVVERLAAALAPGGWLVTAVTDPPIHDAVALETVVTPHGIFSRRQGRY